MKAYKNIVVNHEQYEKCSNMNRHDNPFIIAKDSLVFHRILSRVVYSLFNTYEHLPLVPMGGHKP